MSHTADVKPQHERSSRPQCTRLTFAGFPKAVESLQSAFAGYPLFEYLYFDVPDLKDTKWLRFRWRLWSSINLLDAIRRHRAYTVDGDAVLYIRDAENTFSDWKRRKEAFFSRLAEFVGSLIWLKSSTEQKKRQKEFEEKIARILRNAGVAAQASDMVELKGLYTAPEKQRLGYASVLVEILTAKADAEGRNAWLLTLHHTTAFYARFGFVTAAEADLGDQNATWTRAPVTVSVMVRESRGGLKV